MFLVDDDLLLSEDDLLFTFRTWKVHIFKCSFVCRQHALCWDWRRGRGEEREEVTMEHKGLLVQRIQAAFAIQSVYICWYSTYMSNRII